MDTATRTKGRVTPWNKGKLLGQKPPLKLKEIWAIRIRLQMARRARELARGASHRRKRDGRGQSPPCTPELPHHFNDPFTKDQPLIRRAHTRGRQTRP